MCLFPVAGNHGMTSLLNRLRLDEGGQDLIEYALLSTVIGLVAIGAWNLIQAAIHYTYGTWGTEVNNLWQPDDPVGGGS
jgi:Flp pilus assembly pilin Flp